MINLLKYLVFIILLFVVPFGWLYLIAGIIALGGVKEGFNVMHSLDVQAASFIHGTHRRTISGITGERAELGEKRYLWQARFIDRLAKLFGDDENHCYRAWQSEQHLGECNNG